MSRKVEMLQGHAGWRRGQVLDMSDGRAEWHVLNGLAKYLDDPTVTLAGGETPVAVVPDAPKRGRGRPKKESNVETKSEPGARPVPALGVTDADDV